MAATFSLIYGYEKLSATINIMSKIILAIYVLSATFALVFLKLGTTDGLPIQYINSRLQFHLNAYVVIGFGLYGFSFLSYMYLIAKNDLGYIIPFAASIVYVLLFTASYFVFKEVFTATKLIAIVLIMTGGVLINIK